MTGIGRALGAERAGGARRVGVVGLGAGTLAAYGRPGDYFRFYEINSDVVDVLSQAHWEVALGDGRLSLEREPDQRFDVLVLDAFSSDSLPTHLLTLEAFEVYERHLAPAGVLAVNVSNLHLDLPSVVRDLARARRLRFMEVANRDRPDRLAITSVWMFLARTTAPLEELLASLQPLRDSGDVMVTGEAQASLHGGRPWTDGYSNLFGILK
jgi:hypothetical protein